MYSKRDSMNMRLSASAKDHNLSVYYSVENTLHRAAVIHKTSVNLLSWDLQSSAQTTYQLPLNQSDSKTTVVQVEWFVIDGNLTLVVLCAEGLQIYDESGKNLYFWYHFQEEDAHCRCLASLGVNQLAVGSGNGSVLIFRVSPKCSNATLTNTISTEHERAISCLSCAGGVYMAAGGDDGKVSVYDATAPFAKVRIFDSYRSSVTGVKVWKTWVVSGYGTGHLRIFDIKLGQILAEVTAHARWITAMDVAELTGMVLTASEDSFVRVWQMNPSDEGVMSHKFSECVVDARLCGGRFLEENGTKFAVTSFESDELICYSTAV